MRTIRRFLHISPVSVETHAALDNPLQCRVNTIGADSASAELLIGCDGFASPHEGLEQADAFGTRRAAGHIDRELLRGTGRTRDFLVEAFSKLPNLRVVGLRDYDGIGRSRDGENARWRSYGWSYGYSAIATAARTRHHRLPLPEDESIVPVVFLALALSGCRPQSFEAILRRARIRPAALGSVVSISNETIPVLNSLERVMLNLDDTDLAYPQGPHGALSPGITYDGLKKFLSHTTRLTHLRLNLPSDANSFDNFLTWFQDPGRPFAHLHQLSVLELGSLCAKPMNLVHMIAKLNLKSLSLWKIAFQCANRVEFAADPSVWAIFLSELSRSLPSTADFQSILVGNCRQSIGIYGHSSEVQFADLVTMDENDERQYEGLKSEIRFRARFGSDVRQWLSNSSEKVYIADRDQSTPPSHDESDLGLDDDIEAANEAEEEDGDGRDNESEANEDEGMDV